MRAQIRERGRRSQQILLSAAGLLGVGLIACSVFVERGAKQCQKDSDCAALNFKQSICDITTGICVRSGLNPPDCIPGPAQNPGDFAKICTPSECIHYDNCPGGTCIDVDAGLVVPAVVDAGAPGDGGTSPSDAGGPTLPSCADPNEGRGQVIYMTGSSNFPPLLAKIGPLILKNTGYTPVYQITSSCNGVKSIYGTGMDHLITDPAPGSKTAAATYVTADGKLVSCALGAGGVTVDIGESDIYSSSCAGFENPSSHVNDYLGPNQAMLFVVPIYSSQLAISAEMAQEVFGRGGAKAQPWYDPKLYFVRNANTGTQQMIGRAIKVAAEQFWGLDRGTAKALATVLKAVAVASAEQAIGILSNDYADDPAANLRGLAFQDFGQTCGFWPDSKPNLRDKRSVRDGHYPIWGPLHFFATTNDGVPVSQAALQFVTVVSVVEPERELLNAFIDAGLVPSCAMSVQRSKDLGELSAYSPQIQCGCYFENRLNGEPPADCTVCGTSSECLDPKRPACRIGFCEAK